MNEGQHGFARMTTPVGYIWHRCNVPGHFIQHCPTNGDISYDIRKQKPPTEIQSAPPANDLIPPELHCPVCKALMKDAAFTKCCFRSLCDKSATAVPTAESLLSSSAAVAAASVHPLWLLFVVVCRSSITDNVNHQEQQHYRSATYMFDEMSLENEDYEGPNSEALYVFDKMVMRAEALHKEHQPRSLDLPNGTVVSLSSEQDSLTLEQVIVEQTSTPMVGEEVNKEGSV